MYKLKSHDIKGHAIGMLFLLSSFYSFSQCPFTNNVLLPLDEAGQASVQLSDFFSDPSTSLTNLTINKQSFDCRNIGVQEVVLSGRTFNEEEFSCKEFVVVYDSIGFCSDAISVPKAIIGKIVTEDGQPIQNVTVGLTSDDVGFFRGTNEDGLYLFNDIPGNTYVVDASKNNDTKNGITTQDILVLQRHLLAINTIKSPYQLIAADVNNSNSITAYDMILIRQLILKSIDRFPDNTSWKFLRTSYQFSSPGESFKEMPAATYQVAYTPSISINNNFIGIKIGDLNNSVIANQNAGSRSRSTASPMLLQMSNPTFEEGTTFTVALSTTKSIETTGLQVGFNMDDTALSLVDIQGIATEYYHQENQDLTFSWTDAYGRQLDKNQDIVHLTFIAKTKGVFSEYFNMKEQGISNEVYDLSLKAHPINLEFRNTTSSIEVLPNFPNPFVDQTQLPFLLPTAGAVFLNIYDIHGQQVWSAQQHFSAGQHGFQLNSVFATAGVYFYRMEYAQEVVTGKLNCMK